jgi:outer membrane protein assembly factor BamB
MSFQKNHSTRWLASAKVAIAVMALSQSLAWDQSSTVIAGSPQSTAYWPQFRGPTGDGIASVDLEPMKFSDDGKGEMQNIHWRSAVPGRGWSSPVIADGLVWLTTAIEVPASEEEIAERMRRSGVKESEMGSRSVAKAIELRLLAFRLDDGQKEHDIELVRADDPDAIHSLNSYASPTPVIDGVHIYCHFGTYGTYCVNRKEAKIVWQQQTKTVHAVGPGSSPFIEEDRLILIHDGCDRQFVLALDKTNGKVLWETDRPDMVAPDGDQKKAFCTPIALKDANGRRQLLCMASQFMISYDPSDGKELWRCHHGTGFSVVPRPVYEDGVVYFVTGFGKPEMWAVAVDGQGDVSSTHVRWTQPKGMPQKPSPLLRDGLIYVISDNGVAACHDIQDGSSVWHQRVGGNYSASPVLIGDYLYFASQEGKVTIMKTGREAEVVATNELQGQILASPAMAGDDLIIRTSQWLYRVRP